jgi:hypothetical protein
MKLAHWIAVAGALASSLPAHAAATDPIMLVYRVSGAINNSGQNSGTVIYCSSFSDVAESFEIVIRDSQGNILANSTQTASPFTTFIASMQTLGVPTFAGIGAASIGSSTASVSCTVWNLISGLAVPMHMQRYNSIPNTSE